MVSRTSGRSKFAGTDIRRDCHHPTFFHISSTRLFTSADISMTSGHGRVNPSPGHLRVASIPIFDP